MKTDYSLGIETKDDLLNSIKKYNKLYREGKPDISDAEYDSLVRKLRETDPENEWFDKPEPVEVSGNRKVKLPVPMKSLNKAKDMADLIKWARYLALPENTEVIYMPKFDGVSLLYGEWTNSAFSRGGIENEGQDCAKHCRKAGIVSCTKVGNFTYGEFVFSHADWEKHFKGKVSDTGDPFKSPRNTIAGFINRDEPSPLLRYATFYRYGVSDVSLPKYNTFEEIIQTLCETFGQEKMYRKTTVKELCDKDLMSAFCEWKRYYPIDGIVIYINDLNIWEATGRHQSTGNPLYAIAYKHPEFNEVFETVVKDITWKISKSGALKPVVNIETVNTGDCNMENPTGYNASWISNMQIAKGAKIIVTRSGGVIPKIIETLQPSDENEIKSMWDNLSECPYCGEQTAWNSSYVELCCTNDNCPGRQLAKIIFFFLTCGAENAGEEAFAKIFNAGFTTIKSILDVTFDELIRIDGFGESNSNIILENNRKIKEGVEITTLMHASDCFEGIGKVKARKILDETACSCIVKDLYAFCKDRKADTPHLRILPEVETKTMQSFYKGIAPFCRFLLETEIPVLFPESEQVNTDGICKGMTVCFSGVRSQELENRITKEGGSISGEISKNTNILIVKDKDSSSSKITKAKLMNIRIIGIDEFENMLS
jgi:NAD-dependent DNA ligase